MFRALHVVSEVCSACGHIYAKDPTPGHGVQTLPDPEGMRRQYAKRNEILIKYWRRVGFLKEDTVLLDFGAGSGHILRSLRESIPGLRIECTEAGAEAAKFLRECGFAVHDSLDAVPAESCDAILLIELLEHVGDPVNLLKETKTRLRPGGKMFITTPCGETRTGSRRTTAYDTPEHIQFWTERSFKRCCEMAGLEFSAIRPSIMYPRRNALERVVYSLLITIRDSIYGRQHLVGFLSLVKGPSDE